jgi:hypothetical protein
MTKTFTLTTGYSVDNGRFLFETLEAASLSRKVFVPGAKIQKVLAVNTPAGLVFTNPLVILDEEK